jgi:hydroxypyruvate isomerase
MSIFKQSFAWWCVQKNISNPREFFTSVKKIGYQGVELLPHELWTVALDSGLEIVTEGAGSLTDGLSHPENHAGILNEVGEKLELANKYHIPNLIVFSGNRKGMDDDEGAANTIEGLQKLAPMAESSGVMLVLELLNSKVDHPDYMCDRTSWAVGVVEQVASSHVKILYDIYHMQIMEGDLIRTIRDHGRYFGHVHTAGNPGRQNLDGEQEIYYPPVMRALADIGYDGYVGQEFVPKGNTLDALSDAFNICDV